MVHINPQNCVIIHVIFCPNLIQLCSSAFTSSPNLSLICRVVSTLVYTKSNVIPHVVTFSWFNSTFLHSIVIDHLDLDTSDHLGPPYTICSGSDTTSDYLGPSQLFWDLLTLTEIISHSLRSCMYMISYYFIFAHFNICSYIIYISWSSSLRQTTSFWCS